MQLSQNLIAVRGIHPRLAVLAGDALGDRGADGPQDPKRAAKEHDRSNRFRATHVWLFLASSWSSSFTAVTISRGMRYLAGGSRSASRLAMSRSRKSTRSLSSPT